MARRGIIQSDSGLIALGIVKKPRRTKRRKGVSAAKKAYQKGVRRGKQMARSRSSYRGRKSRRY